jgi:hypothetical protein
MTMPAIAPPLSEFELAVMFAVFLSLLTLVGVIVTVCVTALPDMTVVMMLVAGCGGGVDVDGDVDEDDVEGTPWVVV